MTSLSPNYHPNPRKHLLHLLKTGRCICCPQVRRRCPSMYETLEVLKNLPAEIVREEFLIPEVLRLDITEEDMEREHRKQLKRRKAKAANDSRDT